MGPDRRRARLSQSSRPDVVAALHRRADLGHVCPYRRACAPPNSGLAGHASALFAPAVPKHVPQGASDRRRATPLKRKTRRVQRVSRAGATGLEPATSGVTGRRSNQLNYAPAGRPSCSRRRVASPSATLARCGRTPSTGSRSRSSSSQRVGGMRRGLVLSAFSLVGLAVGAYVGSRVAPHLLQRRVELAVDGRRGARRRGARRGAPPVRSRSSPARSSAAACGSRRLRAARLGRRPRPRRRDRPRRSSGSAPRPRSSCPAQSGLRQRGPALGDRPAARLGGAAAAPAQPARAHRSVPVDRRPDGADAAAERGVLRDPVDPRRHHARRQGPRHGVRRRRRGKRLVRRPRPRRHRGARRRRRAATRSSRSRRPPLHARRRRRVRPRTTTSPSSASRTSTVQPLPLADPQSGASVAIVGYPLDGGAHGDRRAASAARRPSLTQDALRRRAGRAHDHRGRRDASSTATPAGPRSTRTARSQAMIFAARVGARERLRRPVVDRPQRSRARRHARRSRPAPARPADELGQEARRRSSGRRNGAMT